MASAVELVNSATSEKLDEMDWTKNIHICELVAHDQRLAKDVVKALKKRLSSKHPSTQLYSVLLLELLMNNIGDNIHRQVVESGILQNLVKIVKKKSDLPVRDRIFLLLDATQTSLGGSSGRFPQYYSAYYELVSAGVKFPAASVAVTAAPVPQPNQNPKPSQKEKRVEPSSNNGVKEVPESSIIQKASNAMELLKQVLDAVDTQNSEGGARDEFTLDLVEQCSFQKQKVMHLVMASRDEKVVSQAIELNEQLQKVLARHDALLSPTPFPNNSYNHVEVEEEEEAEQLFHRLRKGKACAKPEDEERSSQLGSPIPIPGEMLNRPLIRPLETNGHANFPTGGGAIPPPPAKHVEREKYFKENKADSSPALSLHSRTASTSRSETMDSD